MPLQRLLKLFSPIKSCASSKMSSFLVSNSLGIFMTSSAQIIATFKKTLCKSGLRLNPLRSNTIKRSLSSSLPARSKIEHKFHHRNTLSSRWRALVSYESVLPSLVGRGGSFKTLTTSRSKNSRSLSPCRKR